MSFFSSLKNPYNQLLFALVALVVLSPFIVHAEGKLPLLPIFYSLIILSSMRIICQKKTLYTAIGLMALVAIVLDFLIGFGWVPKPGQWMLAADLLYICFTIATIFALMRRIFSESRVTINTITGSVAVYLLIGMLWIFFYYVAALITPNAFGPGVVGPDTRAPTFFYLSFTTLTTLGYGDIVPTNYLTRVLTCVEAICGQIFLTVFVARLVGLHIAHETMRKN
ncbi:MAG: ion channel [Candidatus Omnitrophota bacterium]